MNAGMYVTVYPNEDEILVKPDAPDSVVIWFGEYGPSIRFTEGYSAKKRGQMVEALRKAAFLLENPNAEVKP